MKILCCDLLNLKLPSGLDHWSLQKRERNLRGLMSRYNDMAELYLFRNRSSPLLLALYQVNATILSTSLKPNVDEIRIFLLC